MSKRKTSATVGFVNGERLVGEEAAVLQPRYPDRVFTQLRDFLGVAATAPRVQQLLREQHLPYNVVEAPERGTVAFQLAKNELYTIEEAVASILHYARGLTQAAADGSPILDAVIAVPAWYGPPQRQALLDAADLAGLNVLSLVNSHAAAALQFGIERNFANKSEQVIFYDMGFSNTQVALVRYSSFDIKEGSKMNTYSQFVVEDVAWADQLGSATLDAVLIDHFAAEYDAAHAKAGDSLLNHPKAVAKLRKQVKRVKQVLSANTEAPLIIEELHNGVDFRSRITREQFEALAGDFWAKAAAPLTAILQRNELKPSDVSAVELLGGGSRMPKLQASLSQALNGRTLDRHLDADEAVSLGAALFAANISTTFRLRKFGMTDGITYPVALREETPGAAQNEEGTAFAPKLLLPFLKKLPVRRVVHLPNITADPVRLHLALGPPSPATTAADATTPLADYELTGVDEIKAKYGDSGKISAHFKADASGLVSLDKAEVILERTELVNVTVPVNTTENAMADPAATEKSGADAKQAKKAAAAEPEKVPAEGANSSEANATAAEPATKVVQRERRRTIRVPLKIGGPGLLFPGLNESQRKALKARMAALQAADEAKAAAAHAKNDLESYIISTRGQLEDDETVASVTTEKQRFGFLAQLNAAEEWLYEGGEDADAAEFKSRLGKLRAVGDPIAFRKEEVGRRAAIADKVAKFGELAEAGLGSWAKTKPWINETLRTAFSDEVKGFQTWFQAQQAAQAKKQAHDEPAYKTADVSGRLDAVRKSFAKLKNSKPPPPLPKPANATAANGTDNATAADSDQKPGSKDGNVGGGESGGGKGAGSGGDKKPADKQQSWEELLASMPADSRTKMEEMFKASAGGRGPKFMNMDDILKDPKLKAPRAYDGEGEFADGLDDHDEL